MVHGTTGQRLLYLIAAVAQGGSAVLVQPFAIRILDPEQWGQVSLMLSLCAVSLVAVTAGFPTIIGSIYFDPENGRAKARSLNAFGMLTSLGTATLAGVVYTTIALSTGAFDVSTLLLIALATIALQAVCQTALAFLRSSQRAVAYVIVLVLATALGHVAGLLAIVLFEATAVVYLAAYASCALVAALIAVALSKPSPPFRYPAALKHAVLLALPALPHSVAFIALQQGEALLINAFQGPGPTGRYNAVMPFALGAIAIAIALSNVWQVTLLSLRGRDEEGHGAATQREAYFMAFLLTLAGTGSAVIGTYILVNGPDAELFALAKVLPFVVYGYIAFTVAQTQLFAVHRTRSLAVITPLVAAIALGIAIYPASIGALFPIGVIKVLAFLVLGLLYVWVARRVQRDLIALKPLFGWMGLAAAATCISLMLPNDPLTGTVTLVVSLMVAAALGYWFLRRRRSAKPEAPGRTIDRISPDLPPND
ncbi:hypothetical protein M3147_04605 [Agromyces mediolanus]|uniref:lipopolysaccharide biosynthesis protein n=1 Tax=Agromyces mediolanus TaxID=41986 RepID=UPI00203B72FB|nr:hypothetical protein [Agromyces mediolanus]MCM3656527.1 hypothetical protein [Agromyces mediolanus]